MATTLEEMALAEVVRSFGGRPKLKINGERVSRRVRERVFDMLPVSSAESVPLETLVQYVTGPESEAFWQKVAKARWPLCNPREHGCCWKRLYLEKLVREKLERFGLLQQQQQQMAAQGQKRSVVGLATNTAPMPTAKTPAEEMAEMAALEQFLVTCRDYVFALQLTQLHSHVALSLVCSALVNLTTLRLQYGSHKVGVDLDWTASVGMNSADCSSLAKALQDTRMLTTLTLSNNNLDDQAVVTLARGLEANRTVTCLDLSHNHVGSSGLAALAAVFSSPCSVLTQLDLSNNSLKEADGATLGSLLAKSPVLESLDVSVNSLGLSGVCGVLTAALSSSCLRRLSLRMNNVSSEGDPSQGQTAGISLVELVSGCQAALESVDLSGNWLGESGGKVLLEHIESTRSRAQPLLRVIVHQCGLPKEIEDAVQSAVDKSERERRKRPGSP